MDNIGALVGIILAIFVVVVLIPMFLTFFLIIFGLMVLIMAIAFVAGVPIEISKDGEVIGHVVRWKFVSKD